MSIYVFLGPTLSVDEARAVLDATYLPPVSMGDVARLVEKRPTAIAIVDGFFEHTPAVWHKEILYALSKGIRVLGSSSMGALRAAELDVFGMEGVGQVYEEFRSGRLEDDDEVAVVHGPADSGYRQLSVAMVNIREGLRRAREAGAISTKTSDLLVGAAKEMFYAERTWESLLAAAAERSVPAGEISRLAAVLKDDAADVKREDALELLERLATLDAGCPDAAPREGLFEPTYHWWRMLDYEKRVAGSEEITEAAVARHVRLFAPRRGEILRQALLLALTSSEAENAGCELEERTCREESSDPFAALGLDVWPLLVSSAVQVDRCLPEALRRLGLLGEVRDEVERKWEVLRRHGSAQPTLADAGVELEGLLAWYAGRHGGHSGMPEAPIEECWEELGFSSWEEALREILAQYVSEKLERARPTSHAC